MFKNILREKFHVNACCSSPCIVTVTPKEKSFVLVSHWSLQGFLVQKLVEENVLLHSSLSHNTTLDLAFFS